MDFGIGYVIWENVGGSGRIPKSEWGDVDGDSISGVVLWLRYSQNKGYLSQSHGCLVSLIASNW